MGGHVMHTYFHPFWFGKSFWNILLLVFPCPTSDRRYTSSYMTTDGTADHTSSPPPRHTTHSISLGGKLKNWTRYTQIKVTEEAGYVLMS